MHAKYEGSISYGSNVMANVNAFATDRQTAQKLDAPEFHSRGIKRMPEDNS